MNNTNKTNSSPQNSVLSAGAGTPSSTRAEIDARLQKLSDSRKNFSNAVAAGSASKVSKVRS